MDGCNIGREDIEYSSIQPDSPDCVLEDYFRQQLEQLYADPPQALAAGDAVEGSNPGGIVLEQEQCENGEEYDFRLFARPLASGPISGGASNVPQRITLRSPSSASGESGFRNGGRPDKYYFAGVTSSELAEQYAQAAVSGQDIIEGLRMRWWGMELPWRATVIKTMKTNRVVGLGHQLQVQSSRKKRNGKKRRIAIRKRFEARAATELNVRQVEAKKEATEREKRTRRNRDKKVKRKQKDKLRKGNDLQDPA